jgi:hypothetical protein
MENKTVRVRTTPGVDKNIMVELNQDFDFLEILSIKISQQDIYQSFCADYGVLIGRVIANRGFGIPNAKVSVFIPISSEDQRNELIAELYPYKTVTSKDADGYRYNLFLSDTTCSINQPIGTFPTKEELLNNDIQLEIFDKYYKYTTKTNSAGDYIIFGVPTGEQTIHLDVDLSDIGLLSMRPYDLIERGYSEKLFNGYTRFSSSDNLDELPQVKTQTKGVEVVPFWGDTEVCNFGITRVDFNAGVEIVPTAIFMGSVFTDTKKNDLGKNCGVTNDMGEQCELTTKAGVIDILRISYDNNGDPYEIEDFTPVAGKDLIDDDGVFTLTLPMYYDRVVTDEFGNLVPSIEPGVGVPTKGKYRFKVKFNEPGESKNRTTASLIVPSLNRIHGGTVGTEQQRWVKGLVSSVYTNSNQPNTSQIHGSENLAVIPLGTNPNNFLSAYNIPFICPTQTLTYFGVQQNPAAPQVYTKTIESDMELDFHTFEWKQVYTISHFIKKFKKGDNRLSFLGIKGCDECDYNNYFPFTTAVKKSSFGFFLQRILINIVASLLQALIFLASLSICGSYRLLDGGKCRKLIDIQPFAFIADIFGGSFELECGSEVYTIPLNCNPGGCSCSGDPILYGDDSDGNSPCCVDSDGNCQTDSCIGLAFIGPNGCNSVNQLELWKCCSLYNAAKENKAIKFTFFDAWLNGSAYLFQFQAKVKRKNNGEVKYKFCGPGSDNLGGDNFATKYSVTGFPDQINEEKTCSSGGCLVMGPSINPSDKSYVGGNCSIRVPRNSPGIVNGANDTGEFVYCNWVSSTKIVSLGPIEMCEDAFSDIQRCIYTNTENLSGNSVLDCSIADLRLGDGINPYEGDNLGVVSPYVIPSPGTTISYNAPHVIKIGTGGESGFDRQETTRKIDSTSYVDPEPVFVYLLQQDGCDYGKLFIDKSDCPECHEEELTDVNFKSVREVCKIHNTIVTVPVAIPGGGYDLDNPEVWDVTGIASSIDPTAIDGPFEVDTLLRDRYHPNPNNSSTYAPSSYSFLSSAHIDPKTNMPYFYFGLIPGKTAMDKFKQKYLVNK